MNILDLQIFFGNLFFSCKNVKEVGRLYQRLIDILETCRDAKLDDLEENKWT